MEINKIGHNYPNFKGYKNIISRKLAHGPEGPYFTYMAMQLDNIGKNDLEIWQNIQKNLLKRDTTTDILTLSYLDIPKSTGFMWLGDCRLGEGLNKFSHYFGEHVDTLKSYLFAHDITERIMNDNSWLKRDNNLMSVVKQAGNDLTAIFNRSEILGLEDAEKSKAIAVDIVANSFIKEDPPQANAGDINHNIYKFIMPFFTGTEC